MVSNYCVVIPSVSKGLYDKARTVPGLGRSRFLRLHTKTPPVLRLHAKIGGVRFDLTLRGKPDRNSLPAVSRLALTVVTALSLIAVDIIWDGRRLSITVDVVLLTVTAFTLTMSASSLTVKKYYDETKDHMSK
ncbi:predicted protein [Postia placenta Mad-698-R]|nr:predicted protein [Postia placenta Mad-698-R]